MYIVEQVDGSDPDIARQLREFNALSPPELFPALTDFHLEAGHWWLVYHGDDAVAFAGMVPNIPHNSVYFKRCYVKPDHVGHGLQLRLMFVREVKARELGYAQIVSECSEDSHSNLNFRRAGFARVFPEQPWGKNPTDVYWAKTL